MKQVSRCDRQSCGLSNISVAESKSKKTKASVIELIGILKWEPKCRMDVSSTDANGASDMLTECWASGVSWRRGQFSSFWNACKLKQQSDTDPLA